MHWQSTDHRAQRHTCLVYNTKTNDVIGGWKTAPSFRDSVTGQTSTYPQIIDLLKNDILVMTADLCPEQNNPSTGMTSVASIRMIYSESNSVPGGPEQMKYFVFGKKQ